MEYAALFLVLDFWNEAAYSDYLKKSFLLLKEYVTPRLSVFYFSGICKLYQGIEKLLTATRSVINTIGGALIRDYFKMNVHEIV